MTSTLAPPAALSAEPTRISPVVVIDTLAGYAAALHRARRSGRTVGVVPTMGALHAGHRSLIERAAAECDVVAVSIFVNPTQFGDAGDLAAYPRTLESDLATVASAGGMLVFAPSVQEMYPGGADACRTTVSAPSLAARWEGASRPGHFDGVATVVVKLLSAAGRCRAYFGAKDFQQLALVTRVARDLCLPVEVVGCETVRDPDGLALSSRNVRLSADERRSALVLCRALRAAASAIRRGEEDPAVVEDLMARTVATEPSVALDYAAVVHADDLERAASCAPGRPLRLLIAATVGPVRLIDNLDPRQVN
ncbi:MAG: pantoate--beta-alanine ligase [Acidimicrobiales bacterium]